MFPIEMEQFALWISSDNTKKVQYIMLFFIFIFALSHHMFDNLLGCTLREFTKNIYVRHFTSILFLFLLVDVNFDNQEKPISPLTSLAVSGFLYLMGIILMKSNQIYILFILGLTLFLIVLEKYKKYIEQSIQDQEVKQDQLDFIFKTNNVSVILMILAVIIGSLTSFQSVQSSCKRI